MDQNESKSPNPLPYAWHPMTQVYVKANYNGYPWFTPRAQSQNTDQIQPTNEEKTEAKPKLKKKKKPRKRSNSPPPPPPQNNKVLYIIIAVLAVILVAAIIIVPIVVTSEVNKLKSAQATTTSAPIAPSSTIQNPVYLDGSVTVRNLLYDPTLSDINSPLAQGYQQIFCDLVNSSLSGQSGYASCKVLSYRNGSVKVGYRVTLSGSKPNITDSQLTQKAQDRLQETFTNNSGLFDIDRTTITFSLPTATITGGTTLAAVTTTVVQGATAGATTVQQANAGATTVQQANAGATTVQQATVGATTALQATAGATTVQQANAGATTAQQATAGATTAQQATAGATTVQQATAGVTTVQQATAGVTTVQQTTAGVTTVQQATAGVTTVQQATAGVTTVQQATAGATTVQQSTAGATTVQQATAGASTVQQATAGATTVQQATAGATTVQQSTAGATTVQQATAGATTVQQATAGAATVQQATGGLTTAQPTGQGATTAAINSQSVAMVAGDVRMTNVEFQPSLENSSSPLFKQMEDAFCSELLSTSKADISKCEVSSFRNGSCIVDFRLEIKLNTSDSKAPNRTADVSALVQSVIKEQFTRNESKFVADPQSVRAEVSEITTTTTLGTTTTTTPPPPTTTTATTTENPALIAATSRATPTLPGSTSTRSTTRDDFDSTANTNPYPTVSASLFPPFETPTFPYTTASGSNPTPDAGDCSWSVKLYTGTNNSVPINANSLSQCQQACLTLPQTHNCIYGFDWFPSWNGDPSTSYCSISTEPYQFYRTGVEHYEFTCSGGITTTASPEYSSTNNGVITATAYPEYPPTGVPRCYWSPIAVRSLNSFWQPSITSLAECQTMCLLNTMCLTYGFDFVSCSSRCYFSNSTQYSYYNWGVTHYNYVCGSSYTTYDPWRPSSDYQGGGTTSYPASPASGYTTYDPWRTSSDYQGGGTTSYPAPPGCVWSRTDNISIPNGIPLPYYSMYACQEHCLLSAAASNCAFGLDWNPHPGPDGPCIASTQSIDTAVNSPGVSHFQYVCLDGVGSTRSGAQGYSTVSPFTMDEHPPGSSQPGANAAFPGLESTQFQESTEYRLGTQPAYPTMSPPYYQTTSQPYDYTNYWRTTSNYYNSGCYPYYQYQCPNNCQCIGTYLRCNGYDDCGDNSDETSCSDCGSSAFLCDGDRCVSKYRRCDGQPDCADQSDELDCTCSPDQFQCTSAFQCVPSCSRCNQTSECFDGSDENYCPVTCTTTQFQCQNKQQCIPACKKCDSYVDCYDQSDEQGCNNNTACPPPKFQCPNMANRCLQPCRLCDGVNDCGDWSDENGPDCSCPSFMTRCRNGQCIRAPYRCDGYPQCDDGSDEIHCPCPEETNFQCLDGRCIVRMSMCDGKKDCPDGSDEFNCSSKCPVNEFTCISDGSCLLTRTQCVLQYYQGSFSCSDNAFVCDGFRDCVDGSDERNCSSFHSSLSTTTTAPSATLSPFHSIVANCSADRGNFQCADGRCISLVYSGSVYSPCSSGNCQGCTWDFHCDGFEDCPDGSDEWDCPDVTSRACSPGQFKCNNSNTCINCRSVCDGFNDCSDSSDETGCKCTSDQFQCDSGRCIDGYLRCNGYNNCGDFSDELNCSCTQNQTKCASDGRCIQSYQRCDGVFDCNDYSDEFNCSCSSSQFRCSNGQCLYASDHQCDGYAQCRDGSDEINCTCSRYQFRCANGQCIYGLQCDGYTECFDGSDEINCTCSSNQFQCKSQFRCLSQCQVCDGVVDCFYDQSDEENCTCDNSTHYRCPLSGKCIPNCKLCDGNTDCYDYYPNYIYDNSDEINCTLACNANQTLCHSGDQCIRQCSVCDGILNCHDGSDELNCTCSRDQFRCENGRCISNTSRCDGYVDCSDQSDELNCDCTPDQFQCNNSVCIPGWARCDGWARCQDGSDELDCNCTSDQFQCDNGRCISKYSVCDGYPTCQDGSDESHCANCTDLEFRCPGEKSCVDISRWCDQIDDCQDGYDETYCQFSNCPSGFLTCAYGLARLECYPYSEYCNGHIYCSNGEDEHCYCPQESKFQCNDSVCVNITSWCDGKRDCLDGSDEPANCSAALPCGPYNVKCKNGRCVDSSKICDGLNQCGDFSDEQNCSYCSVKCDMGTCIEAYQICDGFRDCPDGSDEKVNCTKPCHSWEQKCNNNKCVSNWVVCDGKNDCGDYTDEKDCVCSSMTWNYFDSALHGGNFFKCQTGLCVPNSRWCDGYRDCPDGSDELPDCKYACPNGALKCNATGECINPDKICDRVRDCPDNSDEIHCPCMSFEYRCTNGSCIYRDWLCDGVKDCPLGDDEDPNNCDHCNTDQFLCSSDYTCINLESRCDGVRDCPDSSDENNCLSLNGNGGDVENTSTALLHVSYRGNQSYYVCADYWDSSYSDLACKQMGQGSSIVTGSTTVVSSHFLGMSQSADGGNLLLTALLNTSDCPSSQAVSLKCNNLSCGVRSVPPDSVGPYVINGDLAARGAWPWQVQIFLSGQFRCGGTIINSRWILTAAHCIENNDQTPSAFTVLVGSIGLNMTSPDSQRFAVDRAIMNNLYMSYITAYDSGLLHLTTDIQFTDTASPVCLPSVDQDLRQYRVCVVTGFGQTRPSINSQVSPVLIQGKMHLVSYDECLNYAHNLSGLSISVLQYRIIDTVMICAGSFPPEYGVNVCYGDSGGPLVCQDQHDIWTEVGIVSWTYNCQGSVFARVSAMVDWIQNIIQT